MTDANPQQSPQDQPSGDQSNQPERNESAQQQQQHPAPETQPAADATQADGGAEGGEGGQGGALHDSIVNAIRQVYDPEIPVNLYDLGLIYNVDVNEDTGRASVIMTLTTPNCPEAQSMPGQVQQTIESIPGVNEANVQIVWDPPWTPDKMSDEAKLELGMM